MQAMEPSKEKRLFLQIEGPNADIQFSNIPKCDVLETSNSSPPDSPVDSNMAIDLMTTFTEQSLIRLNDQIDHLQEDEMLRELVKRHGTKKWHIISAKLQSKTPRECSRRWRTYLHMCMNKTSWSAEEDRLLIEGHNVYGNRWTEIAKMVPGRMEGLTKRNCRTDNAVKNRFNALCKKRSQRAKTTGSTNTVEHENSDDREIIRELKRTKFIKNEDREEAHGSFMHVSRDCIQNLYIGIPENNDIVHVRGSATSHSILSIADLSFQERDSSYLEGASPKDGQIDMEEVMGWLINRTPTPTFNGSGNSTVASSTVTSPRPSEDGSYEHGMDNVCLQNLITFPANQFGGSALGIDTLPLPDERSQLNYKQVEEFVIAFTNDNTENTRSLWNPVEQQLHMQGKVCHS